MTNPPGSFIWYELMTEDVDAAIRFYGAVIGWTARDSGMGGGNPYHLLSADGVDVGGLMKIPAEAKSAGMKPCWLGYVGVENVDAAVDKAKGEGASVHVPPTDIPNVGRFAMIADPQGAVFYMMQGASDEDSHAFDQKKSGHGNWHELHTSDWEKAFDFYASQFGWTKAEALDMGPMGTYQLIAQSGTEIGGMMNSPNFPRPMWLYYFGVPSIDDAVARITDNGGSILFGPSEVPGGALIVQATDPQGALFALVGPAHS
ncbi:MAG TPA: VOC family protein [Allosphingosinicella sp.]